MSRSFTILLLTFACFATSISEFAIVGVVDIIAADLGVSISAAGQLLTAFALSGGIGVPLTVMALSRFERRTVMAIALALVAVGCGFVSVVGSLALMMVSRALMAIGCGILAVSSFAAAPGLARPGRETSAIATVTLGFNGALVLGLPIGRLLTEVLPWTAVFWFVGAASALLIPAVWLAVPPSRATGVQPLPLTRQLALLARPRVLFTFGITLFWTSGYATMYSYITPYLQDSAALTATILSGVLLGYGLATLVGNKLGGALADRFGIRKVIVPAIGAQAVMLTAMFLLDGPVWLIIASVIVWGLVSWIPSPIINMAVIQAAPDASDVMLSLNNSFTQLAYAIGSGAGGAVITLGSTRNLCLAAIVLIAVGAASTVLATRGGNRCPALVRPTAEALEPATI
ncbi:MULTISPECIES: MFS transporter [unclassified Actinomyces]|uniref:MFS transporter n=1 Tax=unclassified Actinomyces TaxID=2609248 RepID=UPI0020183BB8|nr:MULTISPECIES: MFS transporter [unclassified Actinomyces]MCL3777622.1 MFS transporter [Actinomyces sp. AC-20-1]MCL3789442.1 MFS transporter [Actinomyces sp. 187325]MCL3791178.1 MFS transporter [Actinomyces sp. 186855]MCL3794428.1 MFS transporter [Actinomyces sp. 217892]